MLWALVHPEPAGPCTTTFRGLVTEGMSTLQADPRCGPRYDACAASFRCQYELRQAVQHLVNGYPAATAKFESTLCSKSPELQALHECTMNADGAFATPDGLPPLVQVCPSTGVPNCRAHLTHLTDAQLPPPVQSGWSRVACAAPDELTPTQCTQLMEGLDSVCEEPAGG